MAGFIDIEIQGFKGHSDAQALSFPKDLSASGGLSALKFRCLNIKCINSKKMTVSSVKSVSRQLKHFMRNEHFLQGQGLRFKAISGGKVSRGPSRIIAQLSKELVENPGLTIAETARQLGVTICAISRVFESKNERKIEFVTLIATSPKTLYS